MFLKPLILLMQMGVKNVPIYKKSARLVQLQMSDDTPLCDHCHTKDATHIFVWCNCKYCDSCKNKLCGDKSIKDDPDADIKCLVCEETAEVHLVNPILPQKRCKHVTLCGPNKKKCYLNTGNSNLPHGALRCGICVYTDYGPEFEEAGFDMDPRKPEFVLNVCGHEILVNPTSQNGFLLEQPDDSAKDTVVQLEPAKK